MLQRCISYISFTLKLVVTLSGIYYDKSDKDIKECMIFIDIDILCT